MAIPTFSNNDLLKNVREKSLNPAIAKVNELDGVIVDMEARIGGTPEVIHTLDDLHPTGWYYFQPVAPGPVPEGFVQYFTLYAEDKITPVYSRCTLYTKDSQCQLYLREWSATTKWSKWICFGAGGFRLDPNPAVQGQNYFKGADRTAAEAARDVVLKGEKLEQYDRDAMLLIMLEWVDAGNQVVLFQGRNTGKWIEPFGEIATKFQLGNHDVSELRDWSVWSQRILASAKTLTNIGAPTSIELASLTGGALSVSKIGNDGTVTAHKEADGTVNLYSKGFWVGYFDDIATLNSTVPESIRIPHVTSAAVKDGANGHITKVWSGTAWEDASLIGGGVYADGSSRKENYRYLQEGPNVTFSRTPATGALQVNLKDVMTSADTTNFINRRDLHAGEWIHLNSTEGSSNLTIDGKPTAAEFKLLFNDSESDVLATGATSGGGDKVKMVFSQPKLKTGISNILRTTTVSHPDDLLQDSDSVSFVKSEVGGKDVIKANVIPKAGLIKGRAGNSPNYQDISKIFVPNPYATITGGELKIPYINSADKSGTSFGAVKTIKASDNISLRNEAGVLTISTHSKPVFTAKLADRAEAQEITGLDISNPYATTSAKILKLPVITALDSAGAEIAKVKNLQQGEGITFTNNAGVITVNAAGGGTGGKVSGKIGTTTQQIDTVAIADGAGVFQDSNNTLYIYPNRVKIGTATSYNTFNKIAVTNPYATFTGGELTLPALVGMDKSGTELGFVKSIKGSDSVTLSNSDGVLTLATPAKPPFTAKIGGNAAQNITGINVSNTYATVTDGKLNLPVISAVDSSGAELAQVKNLKQGSGIKFANTNGVITVSAVGGGTGGKISGKIGSNTNQIDTISIADGAGVFKDSGTTLHINPVEGVVGGNTRVIKKVEVQQNTSGNSEVDSSGKLTIKIPTQGGGTPLSIGGKTTSGTAVTPTQITKITLEDGITLSDTPASGEAKITSLLTVTGKDLDEAAKPVVTSKVTKIEFGDNLDTELVTVEGEKSYARIKALDPVLISTNKSALDTAYPAASNPSRLAFATESEALYVSSKDAWKDLSYAGMSTHVSTLLKRFPEKFPNAGESYDEALHKEFRFTRISAASAKTDLGLPEEMDGILMNMYASAETVTEDAWIQKFFATSTGDEFTRYRAISGASYTWSQWRKVQISLGVLDDSNHSVFVMDNDIKLSGLDATGQVPYLMHTDPTANIIMLPDNKGAFQVTRSGSYNLQCLVQFTNEPNQAITGEDVIVEIKKVSAGETPVATLTFTKANIFDNTAKEFFPMLGKFNNVELLLGETYSIKVTLVNASATDKNVIRFDPYKNMLSIDPATSRTKTGANTLNMLYRTMSGMSYSTGYEVRTEFKDSIIRVFGEKYLSEIKEQVS